MVSKFLSISGLFLLLCLTLVGTTWAYLRGGNDFSVFYEAWRLVLSGQGDQVYWVSPDRFLYSPGFAWLLAPLAYFSREIALGIWCLAKIGIVFLLIKILSRSTRVQFQSQLETWGVAAWGIILLAKPLLIDFSYGQVNLLILGACVIGLFSHFEKIENQWIHGLKWVFLTFAAIAKLYPLPLLLVPWVNTQGIEKKKIYLERIAILCGILICLFLPVLSQGWKGTFFLFIHWKDAVLAKGLPLESHNQSFIALLHHYLSGQPTSFLFEGSHSFLLGKAWLSQQQIGLLSLFWTMTTMGILLAWIYLGELQSYLVWTPVLIGLLILPSHLVWKPYFVMGIPLSVLAFQQAIASKSKAFYFFIFVFFLGVNFTGFDFIGHDLAHYIEAASFLLLFHMGLILTVIKASRSKIVVF